MQLGRLAASCAFGDRRVSDEAARDDCIRHQPPPDQASVLATIQHSDGGDASLRNATDPCISPHDADYWILPAVRSSTGSGPRRRSALLLSVGMQ